MLINERESFSACFVYLDRKRLIRLQIVVDDTIIKARYMPTLALTSDIMYGIDRQVFPMGVHE